MYIVRWLMGHPIIAMWALAAIAILLNYSSGPDKADIAKNTANNSSLESTVITRDAESDSLVSEKAKEDENEVDKATSTEMHQTENVESISGDENLSESINAVSDKDNLENSQPSYPKDVVGNESTVNDIATNTQPTNKSGANIATTTSDLESMSAEDMLLMAREAYWNNGLDEAAQIYKQLIKIEPKTIGYRGELGNVYWRQGYPKKAAELYSEISIPMIEQGEADRVANMIGFIGLFYPDRAAEIHRRLQLDASKTK